MAVYNNARFLREAIESVLRQTCDDFELLILDDASTEDVWSIIDSYIADPRVHAEQNRKNIGYTRSLNILLQKASGDFIAKQDSDDVSEPRRIEKQLKAFTEPGIGMVSTWGVSIDEKGKEVRNYYTDVAQRRPVDKVLAALSTESWILGPSVMLTREVVDNVGYFDSECYFAQDYNYWLRVLNEYTFEYVPEVLYKRRIHNQQVRRLHPELKLIDWGEKARRRAIQCPKILDL